MTVPIRLASCSTRANLSLLVILTWNAQCTYHSLTGCVCGKLATKAYLMPTLARQCGRRVAQAVRTDCLPAGKVIQLQLKYFAEASKSYGQQWQSGIFMAHRGTVEPQLGVVNGRANIADQTVAAIEINQPSRARRVAQDSNGRTASYTDSNGRTYGNGRTALLRQVAYVIACGDSNTDSNSQTDGNSRTALLQQVAYIIACGDTRQACRLKKPFQHQEPDLGVKHGKRCNIFYHCPACLTVDSAF